MSLQLLERLSDFDKEVRSTYVSSMNDSKAHNLPMDEIRAIYIYNNRKDVKTYETNELRDYIHFTYNDDKPKLELMGGRIKINNGLIARHKP